MSRQLDWKARDLMVAHRIHRVPVLTDGRVVGMVSSLDPLAALTEDS